MITISIADRFQTPDYNKFKDIVSKSGSDASLKIKNNKIIYGNSSVEVPFFKDADILKVELEQQKTKLLLQSNDLYDKIVIAEEPLLYKAKYTSLVNQIQKIDMIIDELDSYLSSLNEQQVITPIVMIENEINHKKDSVQQIVSSTRDDVYLGKKASSKLLYLHNTLVKLEQQLKEAKEVNTINYIIWDKPLEDTVEKVNVVVNATKSSSKKLTSAKKAVIKKATKKLMVNKLS
jgi:hypothetical protein